MFETVRGVFGTDLDTFGCTCLVDELARDLSDAGLPLFLQRLLGFGLVPGSGPIRMAGP